MGHGEWGRIPMIRFSPQDQEAQGKPVKNRTLVLLISIGISLLFWFFLFLVLYFAWKR